MKHMEKNKGPKKSSTVILYLVIFCLLFQAIYIATPQKAEAQFFSPFVSDIYLEYIETLEYLRDETDRVKQGVLSALKAGAALAFKNALKVFFGRLAQTTAEWIASGGESQRIILSVVDCTG